MKPLVSALQAYHFIVVSLFAVVILTVCGIGFKYRWESFAGGVTDPEDTDAAATTLFISVGVFAVMLGFCGCQALVIRRQSRIRLH